MTVDGEDVGDAESAVLLASLADRLVADPQELESVLVDLRGESAVVLHGLSSPDAETSLNRV